jgi:hypothetical protein
MRAAVLGLRARSCDQGLPRGPAMSARPRQVQLGGTAIIADARGGAFPPRDGLSAIVHRCLSQVQKHQMLRESESGRTSVPVEGGSVHDAIITPGWQGALCQFFTRDAIARFCLARLTLPKDLLRLRLLEPAAGRGAFILPLIPRLVQACRSRNLQFRHLADTIRAYEVDKRIAANLLKDCIRALEEAGVQQKTAKGLVRQWVISADFLEADIASGFTHIVGNPPYIRWDAIPKPLIRAYRERYTSFKARADLYLPFIEKSLTLLAPNGQLEVAGRI